jgi:hypothetical protein
MEVPNRDEWFPHLDSFPRPDWPAISGWQGAWIGKNNDHDAMHDVVRHWLARPCDCLGGNYSVKESEYFHLVSALKENLRLGMIQFLESTRVLLIKTLGDVAWTDGRGKHIVPKPEAFRRFVKQAGRRDVTAAAAKQQLGIGLGEIAAVFLGKGEWAPKPAAWSAEKQR